MIKLKLFAIEQPIGTFYLGKMKVSELIKIAEVVRRDNDEGTQRQLKDKKVDDISYYCNDPDAVFPTPIIINIISDGILKSSGNEVYEFELPDDTKAEIIDGQHRFEGIKRSKLRDVYLPVVVMFNLDDSSKAYIFSTINNNQTKVDKSLIYDLFGVAKDRSPYKTCHEIARMLNTDPNSPFCGKIKMLEKRQSEEETLSQGTFVTHLLKLITTRANKDTIDSKNNEDIKDNKNLVFRKYFINNQDEVIAKVLINYFSAAKESFPKEWNESDYILTKTIGYAGLIKALKTLVQIGEKKGDLSKEYFNDIFSNFKNYIKEQNLQLTSDYYPSGAVGEGKLCDDILNANA